MLIIGGDTELHQIHFIYCRWMRRNRAIERGKEGGEKGGGREKDREGAR